MAKSIKVLYLFFGIIFMFSGCNAQKNNSLNNGESIEYLDKTVLLEKENNEIKIENEKFKTELAECLSKLDNMELELSLAKEKSKNYIYLIGDNSEIRCINDSKIGYINNSPIFQNPIEKKIIVENYTGKIELLLQSTDLITNETYYLVKSFEVEPIIGWVNNFETVPENDADATSNILIGKFDFNTSFDEIVIEYGSDYEFQSNEGDEYYWKNGFGISMGPVSKKINVIWQDTNQISNSIGLSIGMNKSEVIKYMNMLYEPYEDKVYGLYDNSFRLDENKRISFDFSGDILARIIISRINFID